MNKIVLFVIFLISVTSYAQTTVNSISQLISYLDADNVNIKMTPGTYKIGPDDVHSGLLPNATIFEFSGSNSTYDFTDVKFEFDTAIFKSYGKVEVTEIRVVGNNNVLKNLTMEDIGIGIPYDTALGIKFDGQDNLIEGFHMTIRGSFPYGYGDLFGKGSGSVIFHYKHSAVLIRGERNRLKGCTIIHRAYGHGIFVQGGIDTLVEDCYVEGETRTTDDVLLEEGTGTRADDVDFMTVWGYRVPSGYMFSLQEDGIRAYNNGAHYLNGETTSTKNMTVKNCTIKAMRSGVTIGFCDNIKYVENCTAIGTEKAFWVGTEGEVVNCKADAAYGVAYSTDYNTDRDTEVDITIVDSEYDYYGKHPIAYIGGTRQNITLKSERKILHDGGYIRVSGVRNGMRFLENRDAKYYDQAANDIALNNFTNNPVVLDEECDGANVLSCSEVDDIGTNNSIYNSDECGSIACEGHDAFSVIQAEDFCGMYGIQTGAQNSMVGWVNDGDWIRFEGVNFEDGVASISASVSSENVGGNIEVRKGSLAGGLLGVIEVPNTGSWTSWETHSVNIGTVSGEQDIYLLFNGGSGYLLDVDWFQFSNQTLSNDGLTFDDVSKISIYPNPAYSSTTLVNAKNALISIYDTSGSLKLSQSILNDKQMLDLSLLTPGIYYAKINKELKKTIVKLVKN